MKKLCAALVAFALTLASAVAAAQPVGYVTKRVMDFKGSTVEGLLPRVDAGWVVAAARIRFPSLIEYRYDFVPEMDRAAENL